MRKIPDLKRSTQDGITLASTAVLIELLHKHVDGMSEADRVGLHARLTSHVQLWSAQILSLALPNQVGLVKEIGDAAERVLEEMVMEAFADDASGGS
ncbi:MAG: hypothetical protein EPO08_21145 [Rhodospirillaceae bacterium]|nr:MAG: hypothetical protein EPO08_21145 [Rhodospirillaceae bacterium]